METAKKWKKIRRKQLNQTNNSSIVEPVDVVEKEPIILEKEPSIVEHMEVVEKAEDIKIGTGLDEKLLDEDGEQSGVDSGMQSGVEDGQKMNLPPS